MAQFLTNALILNTCTENILPTPQSAVSRSSPTTHTRSRPTLVERVFR